MTKIDNSEASSSPTWPSLEAFVRDQVQACLQRVLEEEVEELLGRAKHVRRATESTGYRNGYAKPRQLALLNGTVTVRRPRVRKLDERFVSRVLPLFQRRTPEVAQLLPELYLHGLASGDFTLALRGLLGDGAPLSASSVQRLTEDWPRDYTRWQQRDLSTLEPVYVWADGVYFQARLEEQKQCILVLMGSTPSGDKELIAIQDGFRESEQSWLDLLEDVKRRGLVVSPKLAVGDGALGFWKAVRKAYPSTKPQRCWFHKMGNVLNKLPKHLHGKAKAGLQAIWMADSREQAEKAMAAFAATYGAKYPKAVSCLVGDREELLAFYSFPAEHWKHLRTTNPIESTFSTVRLRTAKTRGCLSRTTALTMVFQLCRSAQRTWRKLDGHELLGKVIEGVKFIDGVMEEAAA